MLVPKRPNAVWFPYLMVRLTEVGLKEGPEQEVLGNGFKSAIYLLRRLDRFHF